MQRRRRSEGEPPEPRIRVVRLVAFFVVLAILLYTLRDSAMMRLVAQAARAVVRFL